MKDQIQQIAGVHPGKKSIYTKETGYLAVHSEIRATSGDIFSGCGSGGGGEGELACLIIILVLMAAFAIVWAIIMIAYSILTIGGFFKRRFRTALYFEKENRELLGKLAVSITRKDGAMDYRLGIDSYDTWMGHAFSLFIRLKHIRQFSILAGFLWGVVEVGFKLFQILLDPAFSYDLWPLRYVMIAIFVPLLFYSAFLEFQFRSSFSEGKEIVDRLVMEQPALNPDHAMDFEIPPSESNRRL